MSSGFSDVATHYLECQCTLLCGWIVFFYFGLGCLKIDCSGLLWQVNILRRTPSTRNSQRVLATSYQCKL